MTFIKTMSHNKYNPKKIIMKDSTLKITDALNNLINFITTEFHKNLKTKI